jgi:hypothetical protein
MWETGNRWDVPGFPFNFDTPDEKTGCWTYGIRPNLRHIGTGRLTLFLGFEGRIRTDPSILGFRTGDGKPLLAFGRRSGFTDAIEWQE